MRLIGMVLEFSPRAQTYGQSPSLYRIVRISSQRLYLGHHGRVHAVTPPLPESVEPFPIAELPKQGPPLLRICNARQHHRPHFSKYRDPLGEGLIELLFQHGTHIAGEGRRRSSGTDGHRKIATMNGRRHEEITHVRLLS